MTKRPRLIPNWKKVALRLWSFRLSLVFAAIAGLYSIWPAFQDALPLVWFALLAVGMSVAIAIARITKQPGIE